MNKAFKSNLTKKIETRRQLLSDMKQHALMSCHIKVGEAVPIQEHPLKDEIITQIRSGKLVFS
jgi:hypothetical protein